MMVKNRDNFVSDVVLVNKKGSDKNEPEMGPIEESMEIQNKLNNMLIMSDDPDAYY